MKVVFEKVPRAPDRSFCLLARSGRAFGAAYHLHPEIEITALVRGEGTLVVGDHYGRFVAGDVIVQGAYLPHAYRADSRSGAATLFLQFDPALLGETFWKLPENRSVQRLFSRSDRGLRLGRDAAAEVASRLERLGSTDGPARLAGLLEILAVAAHDPAAAPLASAGYAPPRGAAGVHTIDRILRTVERGWREELRLGDVAWQVGMHPQSLSRFCRRRLGRGFSDLVVARRLGEVSRRLLESEAGIAEAAFACGFNNLSNFNRLFRRAYGCSPSVYRTRAAHSGSSSSAKADKSRRR